MSAMTATSDATSIRNDDECHHKQTFYIPPITLQSMDTFTVGSELLSFSYVMGGIIRILHECQVWIDKSVPRSHFASDAKL